MRALMIGVVGKKRGMTRLFDESGQSIPVTVVEVIPNRVTRLFEGEQRRIQVAWGSRDHHRLRKSESGIYAKASVVAGEGLIEYVVAETDQEWEVGNEITVSIFSVKQKVDVTGTTQGKGYAGVIKRHHFSAQRATHGNSLSHRAPGSIGQCQFPGKVFKGKKMAGHMGNVRRTIQNLEVVSIDEKRNLLLIKGAIPGSKNGKVVIKNAVKQPVSSLASVE